MKKWLAALLLALLPAVLEVQRVCEEGAARLGTVVASGALGLMQHAPCGALFRPVRSECGAVG